MKITRITLYALRMPLHRPYRLCGGRLRFTELGSTFVRIDTDTGPVGRGEGCPWGRRAGRGVRTGLLTRGTS